MQRPGYLNGIKTMRIRTFKGLGIVEPIFNPNPQWFERKLLSPNPQWDPKGIIDPVYSRQMRRR